MEIHEADPRVRRNAIVVVVVAGIVGAGMLHALGGWSEGLRSWVEGSPEQAATLFLVVTVVGVSGPMLGLAFWMKRFASRVGRVGRYPPPDARLTRDTRVRRGSSALAIARLHYVSAAIAVVIAICAPVLVWCIGDVLRFADMDGPVGPSGQQDANMSLNHVFVVLDGATYQGILGSDFLRKEFASFEQRTTVAGDGLEWTGLYFYGASTYVEFFAPEAIDNPIGFAGFAYGVDHPAQLEWVERQWEEKLEVPVVSYSKSV